MGIDIPVQWYADASGQMTIDRFAALPTDQLATTRQILLWLFAKNLVAAQRTAGNVVCRGAALAAARPLFCRPSDYLLPASGQRCPRAQRTFGDRDGARESDLHYRESVLILPAADRRRL